MKILEIQMRNIKIMKILKSIWESRKSWKCRTPSENYENHEIIKTNNCLNHETMKNLRIHLRNTKIMTILEIYVRITKILKNFKINIKIMKIMKIIEIHATITKIIKIIKIYMRIMKIVKLIEIHKIITKVMKTI